MSKYSSYSLFAIRAACAPCGVRWRRQWKLPNDSCKNLDFFVRIGWLADPNGAIHNVCGTKGEGGVPTLPTATEALELLFFASYLMRMLDLAHR